MITIPRLQLEIPLTDRDITITQGNNGPWSHKFLPDLNLDLSHALDFGATPGSRILAPMDGLVVAVMDEVTDVYEGLDPKIGLRTHPNMIVIRNGDFEVVLSHLKVGSARIGIDDIVRVGQPIAESGLSGWVGPQPHLHMHVEQYLGRNNGRKPIPFGLKGYTGPYDHDEIMANLGIEGGRSREREVA